MLKKLLLICMACLFTSVTAFAQTGTLTGTVTDAKTGEPLPGANVFLKENQRGAATDKDGNYRIPNIPLGTYTLRVTFIGYQADVQKVEIQEGNNEINVALKQGEIGLDELVVTGFQTQSKRSLTTSIASVGSKDFQKVPVQNTESILQGRAAGVQVTQTSGNPGGGLSVQVRGQGSINASSRPLYIVDGVEMSFSGQSGLQDESPLNGIDPDDIESISVLKDASATAIYGAQGANGVVLVTTKRGQAGKTQISATVEHGARESINSVHYFNRDQFLEYFRRAAANTYGKQYADAWLRDVKIPQYGLANDVAPSPFYSQPHPTYTKDFSELPNTDWTKFVHQTGITQNYKMSISGGTDQSRYRISGGYENTDGSIKDYNYQNYRIRGNFDQQINSKFSTKLNLSLSNQKTVGTCQDGFYINCPVSQQGFLSPLARPYLDDGTFSPYFPLIGSNNNPAITFNDRTRFTSTIHILGDISGTYDFAPWISLKTQFGMDWRQVRDKQFNDPIANPNANGSINHNISTTPSFTTSTTLSLIKSLDEKNNFSALLGFEYRRDFTRFLGATGHGFIGSAISVLGGAATPITTNGFQDEFRTAGYFANLKYNYDQRYFIEFTGRYDGSSRFGANKRFGFFPAVSAAWSISDEDFFNAGFVNNLKLRASYGSTGNSLLGRYPALSLYSIGGSYNGTSGLVPSQLANPDLTWETATTLDIGVDWGFFNNRFSGSIDVYQKDNSNLLLNRPLPIDSGFGSISENVGKVRNQGIEFNFNSVNLISGDFQWSSNFNISVQRNTVMDLANGQDALNPGSITPIAVGHSINALKVVKWAGVNPADGRPMWYDKDGNITYNPQDSDRQFFDGGEQDVIGGFGNTFDYKGFELTAFLQYSFGQTASPQQVFFFGIAQVGSTQSNGVESVLKDSWQKPGDFKSLPYPKLGPSNYPETDFFSQSSSNSFYDASYIRLKNVSLSYNLPQKLVSKLGVRGVQLYVSGLNLMTWTSYIGFDPEVAGPGGGVTAQSASLPAERVYNGGINVKF